jgi:hypothetical protein
MDGQKMTTPTEIGKIETTLREALKATGLDFALGFKTINTISDTKEGTGYGAFFTVMVDLGLVERSGKE